MKRNFLSPNSQYENELGLGFGLGKVMKRNFLSPNSQYENELGLGFGLGTVMKQTSNHSILNTTTN